jgi:hypothetical protein
MIALLVIAPLPESCDVSPFRISNGMCDVMDMVDKSYYIC